MAPFIGLTGGIGSGKSTALAAMQRLGAATLSTDRVVHELSESDEVRRLVAERFGDQVIRDGQVDRAAVARAAFATDEERRWLEQLLWPRVGERMIAWRAEQARRTPPPRALVVEVPLLFESGLERGYDATIAVIADEAIRQARAGARGHHALDERVARQLTQQEKSQLATYTVVNDGSEAELEARLSSILEMLSS
jgi:dephospho-CoA kinase